MPSIHAAKELTATCRHRTNHKRRIVLILLCLALLTSLAGLIAGCVLEVRWAIIAGIIGIAASVLGLIISMDLMTKSYIHSRSQDYTIDRVTVINDEMIVSTVPNAAHAGIL